MNKFTELFGDLAIIGMIHLAGENYVERALEEIAVYDACGVSGAIVENYHQHSVDAVEEVLCTLQTRSFDVKIGVNVLPNEYWYALALADQYDAHFIQMDYVAGSYEGGAELDVLQYTAIRNKFPNIAVLGGVHPKYYTPVEGSDLETDIKHAMGRCDALVVTGAGTGKETPYDKIQQFRSYAGDFPVIVGAGVTPENAYDQLSCANGAIVGSAFKDGSNTHNPINKEKVRDLMHVIDALASEV